MAAAVGTGGAAGPVHLNLPLREPLVPAAASAGFPYPVDGRPGGRPWTSGVRGVLALPVGTQRLLEAAQHGVVLAGDGLVGDDADGVVAFAERRHWPLLAEPHSNARRGASAVVGTDELLRDDGFVGRHRPDLVVVVGRVGLSRAVLEWLAATSADVVVLDRHGGWYDAMRGAASVVAADPGGLATIDGRGTDDDWRQDWVAAGRSVRAAIDEVLDEAATLTEPGVARDVTAALPGGAALAVASSMPIRDVDLTMHPRDGLRVVANRGVSGIDGFVSTAIGVATVHDGPTWALAGDLSLLHDVNGLLTGPGADLTVVVVNNDGGGIFSLLPQGGLAPPTFERLFGTPHGVDLVAVARAYGVAAERIASPADLAAALARAPDGVTVLEVRTDRETNAVLHRRLSEVAATAARRWASS